MECWCSSLLLSGCLANTASLSLTLHYRVRERRKQAAPIPPPLAALHPSPPSTPLPVITVQVVRTLTHILPGPAYSSHHGGQLTPTAGTLTHSHTHTYTHIYTHACTKTLRCVCSHIGSYSAILLLLPIALAVAASPSPKLEAIDQKNRQGAFTPPYSSPLCLT